MVRKVLTVSVCLLIIASARDASAQAIKQWIDRGYANVNIGFESSSDTLADSTTFVVYDDNGAKGVAADVDSGSLFDFSVGARVWRNASVGLGFHVGSVSNEGIATISVPSPISFSSPSRTAAVTVSDLERRERAFHIQFGYMLPINEKLDVHILGGPSFFRLTQDVISDVTFTEVGSPFTAVNASAAITERKRSVTGAHIGADVTYKLRDTNGVAVGVGGFVRYAGAKADVQVINTEVDTDVGGIQFGFGLRIRSDSQTGTGRDQGPGNRRDLSTARSVPDP